MIKYENNDGCISISHKVIADLVGHAVSDCYGVAGMSYRNKTQGLVMLLNKKSYNRGVKVTAHKDGLIIDLHIVVTMGVNIKAISQSVVDRVSYTVQDITGMNIKEVNVFIDSMKLD